MKFYINDDATVDRRSFLPVLDSAWIFTDRQKISADHRTAHPVHCKEKIEIFKNFFCFESFNVSNYGTVILM
jgi:hypothetical protein